MQLLIFMRALGKQSENTHHDQSKVHLNIKVKREKKVERELRPATAIKE